MAVSVGSDSPDKAGGMMNAENTFKNIDFLARVFKWHAEYMISIMRRNERNIQKALNSKRPVRFMRYPDAPQKVSQENKAH